MARKCQKCGGIVGEADLYCTHCGMPLERMKQEEAQENENIQPTQKQAEPETAEALRMGDYLLIGILLSLPVLNIILAILWATGKKENPNRRNLARAWLVFCAVGIVAGTIFLIGLVRAVQIDEQNYPEYYDDYEYYEDWDDWEDLEEYDYDWESEHHWEDIFDDWGEI